MGWIIQIIKSRFIFNTLILEEVKMYELKTYNEKIKKKIEEYVFNRKSIKDKLEMLKQNPRRNCGAHPLHGRLAGKWACWLGTDIRLIYKINDSDKIILAEAIGSHKVY